MKSAFRHTAFLFLLGLVVLGGARVAGAEPTAALVKPPIVGTTANVTVGLQQQLDAAFSRTCFAGRIPGSSNQFYELFETKPDVHGGSPVVLRRHSSLSGWHYKEDRASLDATKPFRCESQTADERGNVFTVQTYPGHNGITERAIVRYAAAGGVGFSLVEGAMDVAIAPDGADGLYVVDGALTQNVNRRKLHLRHISPTGQTLLDKTDSIEADWRLQNGDTPLTAALTPQGVLVGLRVANAQGTAMLGVRFVHFKSDGTTLSDETLPANGFLTVVEPVFRLVMKATDGSVVLTLAPRAGTSAAAPEPVFLHFDPTSNKKSVSASGAGTIGPGAGGEIIRMHVDPTGAVILTRYAVASNVLRATSTQKTTPGHFTNISINAFDVSPNTGIVTLATKAGFSLLRADGSYIASGGTVFSSIAYAFSDGVTNVKAFSAPPVGYVEATFSPGSQPTALLPATH